MPVLYISHLFLQMEVDEGNGHSDLGQADDVGHVLGLVLHQEPDHISSLKKVET